MISRHTGLHVATVSSRALIKNRLQNFGLQFLSNTCQRRWQSPLVAEIYLFHHLKVRLAVPTNTTQRLSASTIHKYGVTLVTCVAVQFQHVTVHQLLWIGFSDPSTRLKHPLDRLNLQLIKFILWHASSRFCQAIASTIRIQFSPCGRHLWGRDISYLMAIATLQLDKQRLSFFNHRGIISESGNCGFCDFFAEQIRGDVCRLTG